MKKGNRFWCEMLENRFRALLSKLVDPRHQRGQSIRKILKKEL
jgi:hypothetical protein